MRRKYTEKTETSRDIYVVGGICPHVGKHGNETPRKLILRLRVQRCIKGTGNGGEEACRTTQRHSGISQFD